MPSPTILYSTVKTCDKINNLLVNLIEKSHLTDVTPPSTTVLVLKDQIDPYKDNFDTRSKVYSLGCVYNSTPEATVEIQLSRSDPETAISRQKVREEIDPSSIIQK